MVFTRHTPSFKREDPAIAYADGISTAYSKTVLRSRLRPDAKGKYDIVPNLFVCRIGSEYHFLPRTNIVEKISATRWKIAPYQVFQVGDVLKFVEPHLTATVAVLAVNTAVTITVDNKSDIFTFLGTAGNTTSDAAAEMATFINTSPVLSRMVKAIALAAVVHCFAVDGESCYQIATSGGTINLSSAGLMVANKAFGTIQYFADDKPDEVILTGAATNELPVGGHIGVAVNEILGLHPRATSWDNKESETLSIVTGAHGINEWALPYCDGNIKFLMPKMTFLNNPIGVI